MSGNYKHILREIFKFALAYFNFIITEEVLKRFLDLQAYLIVGSISGEILPTAYLREVAVANAPTPSPFLCHDDSRHLFGKSTGRQKVKVIVLKVDWQ